MATAEKSENPATLPSLTAFASPWGVLLLVYAVLLLAGHQLLDDPDTYWHIAAGDWIWSQARVPFADPFSYSMAGAPWTAQEWLSELIFAGCYRLLGWSGVVVLSAAAAACAFAVLTRFLERMVGLRLTLPLVGFAFTLAAPHLTARPHLLALPVLVFWTGALVEARRNGVAPSLRLLPLMTLWANLHGGFILGPVLAAVFAADSLWAAETRSQRLELLRGWTLFIAGAVLASWINPRGPALWLFPLQVLRLDFALNFVQEWHSPDLSHLEPVEIAVLALLAIACLVPLRLAPPRLLLLLGLVHMALSHSRSIELLGLVAPLLLADPLAAAWPAGAAVTRSARRPALAVPVLLLMLATGAAFARGYANDESAIAPGHAFEAARQAGLTGPVFNDFDFGGYLIFRGIPVLIDGRIDLYGDDFVRQYAAALDDEDDALPRLLDRYGIAWALLEPGRRAAAALDHLPGWERLYRDDAAVLFRRLPAR